MLYMIFQKQMTLEEAGKLLNKRIAYIPDNDFTFKSMEVDLNEDEFFKRCVAEIGICDFPARNVVRDIRTDTTYPFSEVGTSIKVLWLLNYFNDEFLIESCYIGQNCFKILAEISTKKDIYIYDNSDMLTYEEIDQCEGYVTNYITGDSCELKGSYWYMVERGY